MILSSGQVVAFNALFLVLLILIGIFTAVAAANLRRNPLSTTDSKLKQSYGLLIGAAVTSFVAMLIVVGGLVYFFATRKKQQVKGQGLGTLGWILLIFAMIAVVVVGILSAAAAGIMRTSPNWSNSGSNRSAYIWSIVAAVFAFVLLVAIIVAMVVFYMRGRKKIVISKPVVNPTFLPESQVVPAVLSTTPVVAAPIAAPIAVAEAVPVVGTEPPMVVVQEQAPAVATEPVTVAPMQETVYRPLQRQETQFQLMPPINQNGTYVPLQRQASSYVLMPPTN